MNKSADRIIGPAVIGARKRARIAHVGPAHGRAPVAAGIDESLNVAIAITADEN
jgi:hypothetical protein